MTLGDGIRRDVATVSQLERDLLLDAIIKLDTTRIFPDGVSYWDKQEDIHKNAHFAGLDVHAGPAFIPWHRALVNRFEALLRQIHPEISLHYWDWTTDPRAASAGRAALFTNTFMGGTGSPAGQPFQNFESTEKTDPLGDGVHDHIWRQVGASNAKGDGRPNLADDATILLNGDFTTFNSALQSAHNSAHGFIGGTIGGGPNPAHFSFHDPFVFLLHSNMDRLWARWQTEVGQADRITPNTAYGLAVINPTEPVEPWAGGTGLEPWASDPTVRAVITYRDVSVIAPPCYDTNHQNVVLDQVINPGSVINFNDVPTGETGARAAVFRIFACGDVTLQVKAGTGPVAPYSVITPGGSVTVPHAPTSYVEGRIWFGFTGGSPLVPVAAGSVTIHCVETGQDFPFTLQANSIARPTVAAMLCVDQSGSMGLLAGIDNHTKRIDVLHLAATNFVQLLQRYPGDAVGMVSFDHNSHPGAPVTQYTGGPFDLAFVLTAIQNLQPAGATSIGNGLTLARNTLNPVTGYDQKALIVFTDGLENTSLFIGDVLSTINDRTFAIGLGTAEQVSTGALYRLTANTFGYLALSGRLSPSIDDTFRLTKYFLQILAGVTNNQIITDPSGYLLPGMRVRIPFNLNEADIDSTAILLTDSPGISFQVETPGGDIMDPGVALSLGADYSVGTNMSYYRFTLPLPVGGRPAHSGTWHAILEIDKKYGATWRLSNQVATIASSAGSHGIRYSFSAQTWSSLRMHAWVVQNSLEPGAAIAIRATLSEYGIPVAGRANVRAHVERPDSTQTILGLAEVESGVFEGGLPAALEGVYRLHVIADGKTIRGVRFTRDQILSAAVLRGGDAPPRTTPPAAPPWRAQLCELIDCLLSSDGLDRYLAENRISAGYLRECLSTWCKQAPQGPSELELDALEGTGTGTKDPIATSASNDLSPAVLAILTEAIRSHQRAPATEKPVRQPTQRRRRQ